MTERARGEDAIAWLIWNDAPDAFFRVDRIFEDRGDALAYIKDKPRLRGESQKFVRRIAPEDSERARWRNRILNELAGHEADAAGEQP